MTHAGFKTSTQQQSASRVAAAATAAAAATSEKIDKFHPDADAATNNVQVGKFQAPPPQRKHWGRGREREMSNDDNGWMVRWRQ